MVENYNIRRDHTLNTFTDTIKQLTEYEEIRKTLTKSNGIVQVSGCVESQKVHFAEGIAEDYQYRLFITFDEQKAKEMYEDMRLFHKNVFLYPAKDFIFYNADIKGNLLVKQRMEVIQALLEAEEATIITTIDGCMDSLVPKEYFEKHRIRITLESLIQTPDLERQLVEIGYERTGQVEEPGQFAIRGGIIDVYPLTAENPIRIELWDEEVDSIRSFDSSSQRSMENLTEICIYPATELILTESRRLAGVEQMETEGKKCVETLRKEMKTEEAHRLKVYVEEICEELKEHMKVNGDSLVHYFYEDTISLLQYFPMDKTLYVLDEITRLEEKGKAIEFEFRESMMQRLEKGYILPKQSDLLFTMEQLRGVLGGRRVLALSTLEPKAGPWKLSMNAQITASSVVSYNSSFETLVKDLERYKKNGYRMVLLSASQSRGKRLADDLLQEGITCYYSETADKELKTGELMVTGGNIHRGYEYPLLRFVVIAESDIFGSVKKVRRKRKVYEGQKINSFAELQLGDYVVHENHGLGVYRGIEKITVDKVTKDYMKIEYAAGGNLYILATQFDMIQKYAGADAKAPKLNKLGTKDWQKTKTKVKKAVDEVARDLVELYAARQQNNGYVYGEDTVWQKEFEEMFPYEETEDQLAAIEATKKDMESNKIMDRLICGDVGYGKTEIAIRAAFKAVQEGKQVVYLVPTTILAQQHYNTFVQRMKDFPVNVSLLSRFRTQAEQKKTLEGLKSGMVDIVVGTHRVLSKNIVYKDLGLLIIDEEQRFGVAHKEKIKKMRENIDVLTLTATPIPRTLHMSLIGIRDMSVLEEPPMDRMPIQTFVMEYNEEMIREAIHRELARNGQVFYVYNRVNDIDEITGRIAALVPEANVAFAHGQMHERELENIMYDFINGEIDVLISTTIIETGMDISNVNTIIIHDADTLGLSQLYQLRGRVGRSNRTAYAFLMYRRNKLLKETAEKRLSAIREYTELGSGFKIAMRDLEIRGAGNLLGERQSGHMEAVGYDLYCKMLNEAVRHYKGMEVEDDFETAIDIHVDAFIPPGYIANEQQKLDIYKRIAALESEEECEEMLEELLDRFGEPPKAVYNLLDVARIKAAAHKLYLAEIVQRGDEWQFTFYEKAKINPSKIPELLQKSKGELTFAMEPVPHFLYKKGGIVKPASKVVTPVNTGRYRVKRPQPAVRPTMEKDKRDAIEIVKNVLNQLNMLLD